MGRKCEESEVEEKKLEGKRRINISGKKRRKREK